LVGAVGNAVSPLEQRHFDVLARDILHGRVAGFTERQRIPRIGDNASCDLDDDTMRIALDRDGMIRPRDLDGLCLQFGMVWHSFGPPMLGLAQRRDRPVGRQAPRNRETCFTNSSGYWYGDP